MKTENATENETGAVHTTLGAIFLSLELSRSTWSALWAGTLGMPMRFGSYDLRFTESCMGRDGREDNEKPNELLVRRLMKEANISEKQARELIELIGTDWASLVREARFLKSRH